MAPNILPRALLGILSVTGILHTEVVSAGAIVEPAVEIDDPVIGVVTQSVNYDKAQTASNGRTILTVWKACSGDVCGVYAAAFDAESRTTIQPEEFLIAEVSDVGLGLAIDNTDSGDDFIVVWEDGAVYFSVVHAAVEKVEAAPPVLVTGFLSFSGNRLVLSSVSCAATTCYIGWVISAVQTCSGAEGGDYGAVSVDTTTGQWWEDTYVPPPSPIRIQLAEGEYLSLTTNLIDDENGNTKHQIMGQFFSASSSGSVAFTIDPEGGWFENMGIVSNEKDFLVYWDDGHLNAVRVVREQGTDFTVLDETPIELKRSNAEDWESELLKLETNGKDYLIIWYSTINSEQPEMHASIIRSEDGNLITSAQWFLTSFSDVDAAGIGPDFFITHTSWSDVKGTWISGDDASIVLEESFTTEPQKVTTANDQWAGGVASDGSNYLTVWSDLRNADQSGRDIYAAVFDASGTRLTEESILVSGAPGDQTLPSVAYNGEEFIVVWLDTVSAGINPWNIYAARISKEDWTVVDTTSIPVSPAPTFDGTVYLDKLKVVATRDSIWVAWSVLFQYNTVGIYGARIDAETGLSLDPNGFFIRNGYLSGLTAEGDTAYITGSYNEEVFVSAMTEGVDGKISMYPDAMQLSGYGKSFDIVAEDSKLWIVQDFGHISVQPISSAAGFPPEGGTDTAVNISNLSNIHFTDASLKIVGDNGLVLYRDDQEDLRGAVIRFASSSSPKAESSFKIGSWTTGEPTIETNGTDFRIVYSKCEDVCRARTRIITLTDEIDIDTETNMETDSAVDTDSETAMVTDSDTGTDIGTAVDSEVASGADTGADTENEDKSPASSFSAISSGGGCSAVPVHHPTGTWITMVELFLLDGTF